MPVTNGGWCIAITVGVSRSAASCGREPAHPLGAQPAAVLPGLGGVAHDQPQAADARSCTGRIRPGRAPGREAARPAARRGRRGFRAARAPASRSGASSSRTRSYSAGRPLRTRSPVATTASGAGSSAATAATTASSLRAGSRSPAPTPMCRSLICASRMRSSASWALGAYARDGVRRAIWRSHRAPIGVRVRPIGAVDGGCRHWAPAPMRPCRRRRPSARRGQRAARRSSGSRSASSLAPERGQIGGGRRPVGEHGPRPPRRAVDAREVPGQPVGAVLAAERRHELRAADRGVELAQVVVAVRDRDQPAARAQGRARARRSPCPGRARGRASTPRRRSRTPRLQTAAGSRRPRPRHPACRRRPHHLGGAVERDHLAAAAPRGSARRTRRSRSPPRAGGRARPRRAARARHPAATGRRVPGARPRCAPRACGRPVLAVDEPARRRASPPHPYVPRRRERPGSSASESMRRCARRPRATRRAGGPTVRGVCARRPCPPRPRARRRCRRGRRRRRSAPGSRPASPAIAREELRRGLGGAEAGRRRDDVRAAVLAQEPLHLDARVPDDADAIRAARIVARHGSASGYRSPGAARRARRPRPVRAARPRGRTPAAAAEAPAGDPRAAR